MINYILNLLPFAAIMLLVFAGLFVWGFVVEALSKALDRLEGLELSKLTYCVLTVLGVIALTLFVFGFDAQ